MIFNVTKFDIITEILIFDEPSAGLDPFEREQFKRIMVKLNAGGIHENDTVLEPSAGRGALIKAIHRACPSVTVECYELMPENREFLHSLENVILLDEDFTKDSVGHYTKIIANPPFSGNQDIEHVRLMYDRLEEGGTLAAITSQHWKFASEKRCIDFRNWLKEVHGEVFEISAGEFKESGTSISTMAVVIKK